MPELPEAQTLVSQLSSALPGLTLKGILIRRSSILKTGKPADYESFLAGRKILSVERRGKIAVLIFDNQCKIWIQLGMTGQLVWKWQGDDAKHVHVVFEFKENGDKLAFRDIRRFGGLVLDNSKLKLPQGIQSLGPEPLEISETEFKARFDAKTGRIKSLLLNQKIIAGIGNIYADESLFRAGVHPLRRPARLKARWKLLHRAMQEVLKEAIAAGGSSIDDYRHLDGKRGDFQKSHRVYGREGKPCGACGAVIRRIVISGRSSFFCPDCQK